MAHEERSGDRATRESGNGGAGWGLSVSSLPSGRPAASHLGFLCGLDPGTQERAAGAGEGSVSPEVRG